MKYLQRIAAAFILAALLMLSSASLAQEGQSVPFAGITVTRGEWILQFTGVTDDQEEIRKGESKKGDRILTANPGYKIVRLSMEVPPECKRKNCDDLEITLVDKAGEEHGFSTRSYWTHLIENEDTMYKMEYLIIVPETMGFADLTIHIAVTGQEEYTSTLAEMAAGASAPVTEAIETVTAEGLKLTMLPPGTFEAQKKAQVHTRLGNTNFIGGGTARAGSSLMMDTIKDTQQYGLLLVSFAFETEADVEAAADLLGELAARTPLEDSGQTYEVKVVWVTDKLCCFVYDCDALKGVPLAFYQDGDSLRIMPKPAAVE